MLDKDSLDCWVVIVEFDLLERSRDCERVYRNKRMANRNNGLRKESREREI